MADQTVWEIRWGNGKTHKSGTRWNSKVWRQFVAWAVQNGAKDEGERVAWYNEFGDLSRLDGPADVQSNGWETWYQNDLIHREDGGPAIVYPDGHAEWWTYGLFHREDGGPAIVYSDA